MATATAQEMLPAIGNTVLVSMRKLSIRCTVLDVRQVYGQMQLNVAPSDSDSKGTQWVSMSRIRAANSIDAATAIERNRIRCELVAKRAEALRHGDSAAIGEIESQIILEERQ